MSERRVLVLIGSPHGARSTSRALGAYLLGRLAAREFPGTELALAELQRSGERVGVLPAAVEAASLVILATPLYWDSLPWLATAALEEIAGAPPCQDGGRQFAAIINSGFPETRQSAVALEISAAFAREVRFEWLGGLVVPCGGAIDGRPLEALGGMTRRLREALDRAAAALAEGAPITEEAVRLAGRSFLPGWAYPPMGEVMWRLQARKNGALFQLRRRPYSKPTPRS
jgi:hypothetical protein